MTLTRITKFLAALALLAIVTACSSGDGKLSAEEKQQGGPDGGVAPEFNESRTLCEALLEGPLNKSEHGPFDNADLNRDGTVLREELESFMDQAQYRRITIIAFFDIFDVDQNGTLSSEEFADVSPSYGFDGTDSNGDCMVTREEVLAYANQQGRSYRTIGLSAFYELVDDNSDSMLTAAEIEAAHVSGLLARF